MEKEIVRERRLSSSAVMSVESIRKRFPALERMHAGQPVAYFDGPGGTQIPRDVADAMVDYLYHHNANTHWKYPTSIETDEMLTKARVVFAEFFNCSSDEVVFGNNMTTLTFHIARALGRRLSPGDEIVVTELDHQANVAPWLELVKERGITIRGVPFDIRTGELIWEELERGITSKVKVLAIGAASNALGTISPVKEAVRLAHAVGALCFVDAVHFAAHELIDVTEIGCDFLVCSPYKFYGPHAGVLFGRREILAALDVPKLAPAPNQPPERIETGTQNHEGIAGSCAAVEFIASLADSIGDISPNSAHTETLSRRERLIRSYKKIHERGEELVTTLWEGLNNIPGVACYGPPPNRPRTPTVSFTIKNMASEDVATNLAREGIFVSNGNFYATTVVERLACSSDGLVRVGCACYNTTSEVNRLLESVKSIAKRGTGNK